MQGDLRVALLLQVCDDALADEVGRPDDVEYFIVVLTDERELKAVFGRIDGDGLRLCGAVEAVENLALDTGEVDWLVKGLDNSVVAGNR